MDLWLFFKNNDIFINKLILQTMNTNSFIKRAKEVHGDKYDYSKVKYINSRTKVCIICPEHGEFWQKPYSHLKGFGCSRCGGTGKVSLDEFIKRAKEVHGDKYDYSKVEYKGMHTKVCIICPEHGEFWQKPSNHISLKQGCPMCNNRSYNTKSFIKRAREVHGDKYDYSKVEYINAHTKVCIICSEHGEFWQRPNDHLNGCGCPNCGRENVWNTRGRITTEEFIKRAREVHGDKYDYSKVEYINKRTPVCIICNKTFKKTNKIHGEFWQTPNSHLNGNGCPKCRNSRLEEKIYTLLYSNKIKFQKEKTFEWLRNKQNLYLDFYLEDYNLAIECQGIQHFIPLRRGKMTKEKAEKNYEEIKQNDLLKQKLCKEHNIKILYFTNKTIFEKWNNNMFENIEYEENNLLKLIEYEK